MPAAPWQEAKVREVFIETPETKTFRLDLEQPIDFLPGQYVNIRFEFPDRGRVQRAYSIDSSPTNKDFIDLTIRKFEDGTVSKHMCDNIGVGDVVPTRGPFGKFVWTPDLGGPLYLIAAGSGIVPLMCMIRYCDELKIHDIPITLLYSSKSWDYIIHRDQLAEIESRMPNLEVIHTLTRSPNDERVRYHRRIDKEMIEAHLPAGALCYICGPPEMCENSEKALIDLGVPPERIKLEKYD
ncbi:MAG: oxidoreductase [Acidimicrobiia bacterium]